MSQDERDYYYDSKRSRTPSGKPPDGGGSWLTTMIVWVVCGVIVYALISNFHTQQPMKDKGVMGLGSSCEQLPPNGGVFVQDPSVTRRSDAIYSGLKFESALNQPAILVISNPEKTVPYQSVAVHPGQTAQVSLPIGLYGLTVLTGNSWCNIKAGFINGLRVDVTSPIEIKTGETASLNMQPSLTAGRMNLMVSYASIADELAKRLPKQVYGNGYMDLRRDRGNYRVNGSINGAPVNFMVDTGATITSINQQAAAGARIPQCMPRTFNTANGTVNGCVGIAQTLTFGNFRIDNVEVAIMPQMEENLLGMNVLSRVRMEQQNEILRLSSER